MISRFLRDIRIAIGDFVLLDYVFDWRFGTDTVSRVHKGSMGVESANKVLGYRYQGSRSLPLTMLFRKLNLGPNHTLLDLGCGKGKVLMVAARSGFQKVHGVEWSRLLCEIAEKNIAAFRRRTGCSTVFKIVQSDAMHYPIQDSEDVFYFFQPFDEIILQKVLRNIRASLRAHPRRVWIIYLYIPKAAWEAMEKDPTFRRVMALRYLRQSFHVYSNQP